MGAMEFYRVHERLVFRVGDLTAERVDAIVNAANSSLLGGGGVDGAIHRAAGPDLLDACRNLRRTQYPDGLATGMAAITPGGRLPARYVIHTVGPIYGHHRGEEARLLAACYRNSIALAVKHGLATLAFPAISTGVYAYPKAEAARISVQAVEAALAEHPGVREVRLVYFSQGDAEILVSSLGANGR